MPPNSHICLFGGTFDPIHLGHSYIALQAQRSLQLDKVIFLPCRKSPHKLDKKTASEEHRLKMCQLATEPMPWAEIHDHDLTTPAPSYSWKTAEYFKSLYPDAQLYWLMGTDQWNALHRWNNFEHLASLLDFIVFTRGDDKLVERPFKHSIITGNHPASSTKVRNHYLHSDKKHPWLHPEVAAYIQQHQLY